MFGFLNINKPSGITSHRVISVLRKITGIKQIGHGGTLDPLASGVLPVAIGKATKLIDFLPSDKRYTVTLEFGKKSDTYDIEGNIEQVEGKKVTVKDIERVIVKFKGNIKQAPPAYSAVHYEGKRLYELARKGNIPKDVPLRSVNVYKNEIIGFDEEKQRLELDIECSKGTYIRTIVNDLGKELNTGAVMYGLIRTFSGGMAVENSLMLSENVTIEDIEGSLINPCDVLEMKSFEINEMEYNMLINGNKFRNRIKAENEVILTYKGRIMALVKAEGEFIHPKKLLN